MPENLAEPIGEPVKKQKRMEDGKRLESLFRCEDSVGFKACVDENVTSSVGDEPGSISKAFLEKEISNQIYSGELESGLYRGLKGYALYAEKSDSTIYASKYTGSLGPINAPNNIRTTCRFDYAYGLCKDWKVSGYCGYGDSCIFVHDRSEFKTGWELEKEWEKDQEEKRKKAFKEKEVEENKKKGIETEIEPGCGICNGKKEVITQCKHKFCFKCCMEQYQKSPKCYTCGKDTKGIFNDII